MWHAFIAARITLTQSLSLTPCSVSPTLSALL